MIYEADMSAGASCLPCSSSRAPLLFIYAQIQVCEIQDGRRGLMDARADNRILEPITLFPLFDPPDVSRLKAS